VTTTTAGLIEERMAQCSACGDFFTVDLQHVDNPRAAQAIEHRAGQTSYFRLLPHRRLEYKHGRLIHIVTRPPTQVAPLCGGDVKLFKGLTPSHPIPDDADDDFFPQLLAPDASDERSA
jgi:hypothetical protein